jgi:hypothetical protein
MSGAFVVKRESFTTGSSGHKLRSPVEIATTRQE